MDAAIKINVKELMEQIESYETDFMDHCKMTLKFIDEYKQTFDFELVLEAVQVSIDRVTQGECFFDEFDTNGLLNSLEAVIEYEIDQSNYIIDEAETEREKQKAQKRLWRLEQQQKKLKLKRAKND